MRLFQYSCRESLGVDLRQANAVLRKRPDAIFFEAPYTSDIALLNDLAADKKKWELVEDRIGKLSLAAIRYPWVASDIAVYKNIRQLWRGRHDIKLYEVDAPSELLQQTLIHHWNTTSAPHRRGTHFSWWVYIYLRERIMAERIDFFLQQHKHSNVGLVFLQKFHWLNVQFLLSKPSKNAVFEYYFGKFPGLSRKNVDKRVMGLKNPTIIKYWRKVGGV